jgi:putative membrane protein
MMTFKTNFKIGLLKYACLLALIIGAISCNDDAKVEDTKDLAEEHNDAKFDNTAKEKDAQFLVNAAEINLEEIELGQLAQQKSKNKLVTDLGKMMQEAHQTSMNDLTALAAKKIITIPNTATENAKEVFKKLDEKSGKEFDNEYCKLMVDGHTKAISIFDNASTESNDADIKAWALATLPTLRQHLDHAISCQKECEKVK